MKLIIIYRLYNPNYGERGNPETLSVSLNEDRNTFSYSLYGGWQSSGMGFAISNLQLKKTLPSSQIKFDLKGKAIQKYKNVAEVHKEIVSALATGCGSHVVKEFEIVNQL